MLVWQLMSSDVLTLDIGETLDIAEDVMKQKRIRHLPVLEEDRLVGIVSQRDLFRAGLSSVLEFRRYAQKEWLQHIRVAEVMVRDLVVAAPEGDIEDAVGLMIDHRIGCLPIVSDSKLVGLLSESDCLRYLQRILQIADVKRRIAEEEPALDPG